jgi:four helix bundle protein
MVRLSEYCATLVLMLLPADFERWEATVPQSERADALWRVQSYRRARFLVAPARADASALWRMPLGRPIASQLWRAIGSISANVAEGYSRGTGPDRGRFIEYALGSTREAIVWYEAARSLLPDECIGDRQNVLVQVRRLLLASLPSARRERIRR